MPINTPDGTQVSEIILPDGSSATRVLGPDGNRVFGGAAIPDSGVLRYRFEQDLSDEWGSNDGTDNTGAGYTTTAAEGSYAKAYDGTDDYITYPTTNITGPFNSWTVAIYVYLNSLPSSEEAICWHPRAEYDIILAVDDGSRGAQGEALFSTFDGNTYSFLSGVTLSTGQYYLLGASNDGAGSYTVRVDTAKNTESLPAPNSVSSSNFVGGRVIGEGPEGLLDGTTDDFRIFDKELTDSEWNNLYNTGSING